MIKLDFINERRVVKGCGGKEGERVRRRKTETSVHIKRMVVLVRIFAIVVSLLSRCFRHESSTLIGECVYLRVLEDSNNNVYIGICGFLWAVIPRCPLALERRDNRQRY